MHCLTNLLFFDIPFLYIILILMFWRYISFFWYICFILIWIKFLGKFWNICYFISYPADTWRSKGVPWRSPKGPNVRDLQGTFRGLSGDQKLMIWWKSCFLEAIVHVLHTYSCFSHEEQIFKSSKWGCPGDVYGTQLRDVPETKWWDVLGTSGGTSVKHDF